MNLQNMFKKKEFFFGVDLGSSGVKFVELDCSGVQPKLLYKATAAITGDVFSSNTITQAQKVADRISSILEHHDIGDKYAVMAVPAPAVFTKRIKMPKVSRDELDSNVQFEAGNFIPHNINAVKLDYHVIAETGKGQLEVLVVAVKNEIIDSFLDTFGLAGINVGIVDVDYFAIQNAFELNYPEYISKNVALVNIGARYSAINICRDGQTLFTGDISVGGKSFSESLSEGLGIFFDDAERLKKAGLKDSPNATASEDILKKSVEDAAIELNRQLSFFWNATGSDEGIDLICLSGAGALVPGLREELQERTGIECIMLDPFRAIDCSAVEQQDENGAQYAVAVGLAMRQFGDKVQTVNL